MSFLVCAFQTCFHTIYEPLTYSIIFRIKWQRFARGKKLPFENMMFKLVVVLLEEDRCTRGPLKNSFRETTEDCFCIMGKWHFVCVSLAIPHQKPQLKQKKTIKMKIKLNLLNQTPRLLITKYWISLLFKSNYTVREHFRRDQKQVFYTSENTCYIRPNFSSFDYQVLFIDISFLPQENWKLRNVSSLLLDVCP